MNYRNEKEIVIHSLGRSGSHVIKNWIASMYYEMFEEPVYCFSNCKKGNPFKAPISYWRRVGQRPLKKFFVNIPRLKDLSTEEIIQLRGIHKSCLMYAYEHKNIIDTVHGSFVTNQDLFIGNSKNKYIILILRDVFNWLASLLLHPGQATRNKLNQFPKCYIPEKKKEKIGKKMLL